jgi:hypothetical protein
MIDRATFGEGATMQRLASYLGFLTGTRAAIVWFVLLVVNSMGTGADLYVLVTDFLEQQGFLGLSREP